MTPDEQSELRNLLVGYFGDSSREDGVRQLLFVTRQKDEYHRRHRATLETGAQAARAGDQDVLRVVRELSPFVPDIGAAEALITAILDEYDRQYAGE